MHFQSINQVKVKNKEALSEIFHSASPAELHVLYELYNFCQKHKSVYVSQETIARRCGVTRETVNRCMKRLFQSGLIDKTYRHNQTCIYKFQEWYLNKKLRLFFLRLLKAVPNVTSTLIFVALVPLLSTQLDAKVTQVSRYNNIYPCSSLRSLTNKDKFLNKLAEQYKLDQIQRDKLATFPIPVLHKLEHKLKTLPHKIYKPFTFMYHSLKKITHSLGLKQIWKAFYNKYPNHSQEFKMQNMLKKLQQSDKISIIRDQSQPRKITSLAYKPYQSKPKHIPSPEERCQGHHKIKDQQDNPSNKNNYFLHQIKLDEEQHLKDTQDGYCSQCVPF